jgi:hypothetical protein
MNVSDRIDARVGRCRSENPACSCGLGLHDP